MWILTFPGLSYDAKKLLALYLNGKSRQIPAKLPGAVPDYPNRVLNTLKSLLLRSDAGATHFSFGEGFDS